MTTTSPEYNTHAVTKRTGIPAATFLSWERRYGVPQPVRDNRGQRRYSESDIRQIEWIRDQVARGLRVSDIAAALDRPASAQNDALKAPVPVENDIIVSLAPDRQASSAPLPIHQPADNSPGVVEQLIANLRNFDDVSVSRLLATEAAVTSAVEAMSRLIPVLLRELRDAVAADSERVVTLHFAEEVFARKLGTLLDVVNPDTSGQICILATVSESTPRIELLLTALAYANKGVRTTLLGTNISLPDLLSAVASHGTSGIVLVASTIGDTRIAQSYRDHIELVVSSLRDREVVIHQTFLHQEVATVHPSSSSATAISNALSHEVPSSVDQVRSS